MPHETRLSINVDHVATLRQARGVGYPDPLEAARLAEEAGAQGITIHLRQDRRHIQESDLFALREAVAGKLNLEISTSEEMLHNAIRAQPDQATLVPERPEEITTEGGLDLETQLEPIRNAARRLSEAGISVSLFLDPDPGIFEPLSRLEEGLVDGFEINTDAYSRAGDQAASEVAKIRDVAERGENEGFEVYAGHGLTVSNVAAISDLPQIRELNIGHSVVSHAVLVGMKTAVRELLDAMGVS